MGSRYDPMLAMVNSWWWEYKFLKQTNKHTQTPYLEILRDPCRANLVHFCLPHICCFLNPFVADVGNKVTGTNSQLAS